MADTTTVTANTVEAWAEDEFLEYVRGFRLAKLMGTDANAIIQLKEELTKESGDAITISLVHRLTGDGVEGDDALEGNEEALGNSGHKITVNQIRHGVVVGKMQTVRTKIDLLAAAKAMLRLRNKDQLRSLILSRMGSPNTDGITTYASSTEAQKDAWETANNPTGSNQRVVFGAALANSTLDHSAGLLEIDGTNDDLAPDIVSLLRRQAMTADPHIRPHVTEDDNETFVLLVGSLLFRDLYSNMSTILQNAEARGMDNPLFSGGDLYYMGTVIKEVPEITVISGVGASSIDVGPAYFCGAQSVGLCWGQRMQVETDSFDYKNKRGVSVGEIRGAAKLTLQGSNTIQHGMVNAYCSAVGD